MRSSFSEKNQTQELVCVSCPRSCALKVLDSVVTGNNCERGKLFALNEVFSPKRVVTSTVRISGKKYNRLPVKTSAPVCKDLVLPCIKAMGYIDAKAPIVCGDVLVRNILNTGADVIATKSVR